MEGDSLLSSITEKIEKHDIKNGTPYPEIPEDFDRASVLLPITIRDGEIYLLLTKRSKHLRSHPSAISFPGGKRDEQDATYVETALREAEEEIGLPSSCVKVLGILSLGVTLPKTVVYPVVGIIPSDFVPVVNPSEVEFAFYIPVKHFLMEENIVYKSSIMHDRKYISRSVRHEDGGISMLIYGFTAIYCILLAKILFTEDTNLPVLDKSGTSKDISDGMRVYFDFVVKQKSHL